MISIKRQLFLCNLVNICDSVLCRVSQPSCLGNFWNVGFSINPKTITPRYTNCIQVLQVPYSVFPHHSQRSPKEASLRVPLCDHTVLLFKKPQQQQQGPQSSHAFYAHLKLIIYLAPPNNCFNYGHTLPIIATTLLIVHPQAYSLCTPVPAFSFTSLKEEWGEQRKPVCLHTLFSSFLLAALLTTVQILPLALCLLMFSTLKEGLWHGTSHCIVR